MSNKSNTPPDSEDPVLKPITRPHSASEKFVIGISDRVLPNKAPNAQSFATLSPEQKEQIEQIEKRAIVQFVGMLDELESALGMLRMGHHMGWKVLYMIHSKKTIRKYEEILDIKIRDIFPDEGPSAGRSVGLGIAKKFSNFWKVVSGETELTKEEKENRRKIE
ncbi:hypothetical protein [Methylotenera versatilis]|uniref:hypothetical protein n=1 Tax=Methylotenera versatilis TaxID=1055487 RepID=UPI00068C11F2|nr:hypothetical protein [Methylotenera versatilis]